MFIQTNNYVKRPLSWENRTVTLTFTSFFSLPIPHMDMSNTHYRLVPFEIMDNFFELYNCNIGNKSSNNQTVLSSKIVNDKPVVKHFVYISLNWNWIKTSYNLMSNGYRTWQGAKTFVLKQAKF